MKMIHHQFRKLVRNQFFRKVVYIHLFLLGIVLASLGITWMAINAPIILGVISIPIAITFYVWLSDCVSKWPT